jgi:hypothetical protein
MGRSDEYRARLEQIDGKLRRARQGRGRRREQMLMLLDQLEAQYQRQKQELTGAWSEIDRLETLVEQLEDRLEKMADEFERDSRQTDELIGRIARMDGVLKHVVKVRKAEPAPAPQRPPPQAESRAPSAAPPDPPRPPEPAPPAPPDGADGPAPPAGPGRAEAFREQERPMPSAPAGVASYSADPRDPFEYVRFFDKKA